MRLTEAQILEVEYNRGFMDGKGAVVRQALEVKVDTLRTDRAVVWFNLEYWKSLVKEVYK